MRDLRKSRKHGRSCFNKEGRRMTGRNGGEKHRELKRLINIRRRKRRVDETNRVKEGRGCGLRIDKERRDKWAQKLK